MKPPWRKVTASRFAPFRYILTLSCGHTADRGSTYGIPKRARCVPCAIERADAR